LWVTQNYVRNDDVDLMSTLYDTTLIPLIYN